MGDRALPGAAKALVDHLAVDENPPFGWLEQRHHEIERRALPAACSADEPHPHPFANAEVDAVQHPRTIHAVVEAHVVEHDGIPKA
jgi:hypothetical protein